jgi:hypothetical protein
MIQLHAHALVFVRCALSSKTPFDTWVKEHDSLQTRHLGIVHIVVPQRLNDLVKDASNESCDCLTEIGLMLVGLTTSVVTWNDEIDTEPKNVMERH